MGERVIALAFLAGSGLYLALAFAFPFGSTARPGPGYFPVAIGVFLCLVAGVFTLVALRRHAGGVTMTPTSRSGRARAGAMTGALAVFVLLLPWIGYPLAAFGFVAILLRRLGGGGWPVAIGAAVVSAALSYWVFAVLLSVPLPRGVLLD